MEENFNRNEINKLISSALADEFESVLDLRALFEKRIHELSITSSQASENIGLEYRTLHGILDNKLKRFDLVSLLKIGHFLLLPEKALAEFYLKTIQDIHHVELEEAKRRAFILNNFDLQSLKENKIISTIRDFDHVENELKRIFCLKSILDFDTSETGAALSATKVIPKNEKTRVYFKHKAREIFKWINNPNQYDPAQLNSFFGKIRRYSTDVDAGLLNVIRELYKMGITILFLPVMKGTQLRGATLAINKKPCIVLTDYRNSYPTLWFALLHELFHVIFDWDEILKKKYHLSEENKDIPGHDEREDEANSFAHDYLVAPTKWEIIEQNINDFSFIKNFAFDNHTHPSIIFSLFAYGTKAHARFSHLVKPDISSLKTKIAGNITNTSSIQEIALFYKKNIINH